MAYEFAPWIHAPESIAKSYGEGVGLGEKIQSDRAEMAQRQAEAQQKAQYEMAQQMAEQQRLAQGQQQIAQTEQLNQIKMQDAQRRVAAQQQYQADLASGMDQLQAIMKNFPGTDESMTGYGQLARQQALQKRMFEPPKLFQIDDPEKPGTKISFLQHPTESGFGYTPIHEKAAAIDPLTRQVQMETLRSMQKDLDDVQKEQEKADEAGLEGRAIAADQSTLSDVQKGYVASANRRAAKMAQMQQQIQAYRSELLGGRGVLPPPEVESPPSPAATPQRRYDPQSGKIVPIGRQSPGPPPQAATPAPSPSPGGGFSAFLRGAQNAPGSSAYGIIQQPSPPPSAPAVPPGAGPPFRQLVQPPTAPTQVQTGPMQQTPQVSRDQAYNQLVQRYDKLSDADLVKAYKRLNPGAKVRAEDGTFYGPDFTLTRHIGRIVKNDFQGNRDDMIDVLAMKALEQGSTPVD